MTVGFWVMFGIAIVVGLMIAVGCWANESTMGAVVPYRFGCAFCV